MFTPDSCINSNTINDSKSKRIIVVSDGEKILIPCRQVAPQSPAPARNPHHPHPTPPPPYHEHVFYGTFNTMTSGDSYMLNDINAGPRKIIQNRPSYVVAL